MVATRTKFVEPFGHFSSKSKLERVWDERPDASAIQRRRTASFDPLSGLSFAPMEYEFENIDYSHVRDAPDREWVDQAFLAFVKGEFGSGTKNSPAPKFPRIVEETFTDDEIYQRYTQSCEREMLYAYYRSAAKHNNQELFENFKALLSDDGLGNKSNTKNAPFDDLKPKLQNWAETEARILCILPSFPFKDQSVLRTANAKAKDFDLGEVALVIRLHLLSLAFYQFHPWGVDWLLTADGTFYADMFGVERSDAVSYFERLRAKRNQLNISGTISIIDLEEIIQHYRTGCDQEFQRDRSFIYTRLGEISKEEDNDLSDAFSVLKRGMRQGQSTRDFEGDLALEEVWKVCMWETVDEADSEEVRELHHDHDLRAAEIAISYAAENLMLRRHDVLNRVFPDNIRTTVHPKPGQVAVPQVGSCFPWNGVAFIPNVQELSGRDLEVRRFYELGRKHSEVIAHVDRHSGATLFYSPAGIETE